MCAGPVNNQISGAVDTYLSTLESYGRQTLSSELGEICCYPTSHLPLGVTNEGQEANIISRTSSKFLALFPWIPRREKIGPDNRQFLAPLPGTPIAKIGELHTILYLHFLVLLVY